MDPYTKTGLRLNLVTPLFPPGASRPAPTSTEEQDLLFRMEPQPDQPPDSPPPPETPGAIRKEVDPSKISDFTERAEGP
jgi:hypothetical protein